MIAERHKIDEYYQALVSRDSQYSGIFYVGVTSTNVFCISTCRARKPKKENVIFYDSVEEALQHGYRPCKVCRPTENLGEPPTEVKKVIRALSDNPEARMRDADLTALGIQPEKIRRWFKSQMGITFQAYQRMIRINTAYENLKKGSNVTSTAYESGYNSLSGFTHTFKHLLETSPQKAMELEVIYMDRFTTPLGPMYACATSKGVCLVEFTDRRMLETELKDLIKRLKAKIMIGENEHIATVKTQMAEYYAGKRTQFDVPLDTPGTPFQQSVWQRLQRIPYGETQSYKQLAEKIGSPKAIRAVANANGHNKIAIIIPCHRVIGSDGSLTGYGGGIPRKKWLLELERSHHQLLQ